MATKKTAAQLKKTVRMYETLQYPSIEEVDDVEFELNDPTLKGTEVKQVSHEYIINANSHVSEYAGGNLLSGDKDELEKVIPYLQSKKEFSSLRSMNKSGRQISNSAISTGARIPVNGMSHKFNASAIREFSKQKMREFKNKTLDIQQKKVVELVNKSSNVAFDKVKDAIQGLDVKKAYAVIQLNTDANAKKINEALSNLKNEGANRAKYKMLNDMRIALAPASISFSLTDEVNLDVSCKVTVDPLINDGALYYKTFKKDKQNPNLYIINLPTQKHTLYIWEKSDFDKYIRMFNEIVIKPIKEFERECIAKVLVNSGITVSREERIIARNNVEYSINEVLSGKGTNKEEVTIPVEQNIFDMFKSTLIKE